MIYNSIMLSDGLKGRLASWAATLAMVLAALVVIAIGELLPPLQAVQNALAANPQLNQALMALTIGMTAAGVFLLAFTQFLVKVPDSRREQSAVTMSAEMGGSRWSRRFFYGISLRAGFHDEARMWQLKRAFQKGEWWSVPRWRRFTLMMLGAALVFYGLFGLIFIIGTPGIKLLALLVLGYGTIRTVWAFSHDRPFRENTDH